MESTSKTSYSLQCRSRHGGDWFDVNARVEVTRAMVREAGFGKVGYYSSDSTNPEHVRAYFTNVVGEHRIQDYRIVQKISTWTPIALIPADEQCCETPEHHKPWCGNK